MKLENQVVVVTGGEGPLGRAVAAKFLAEGARLVIGWYSEAEWAEAEVGLGAYRERFVARKVDVADEAQVAALMRLAKDTYGGLDGLLQMAGMYFSRKMVWETDTAIFDRLISVNLRAAFLGAKHAVPYLREKGRGNLVFFPARVSVEPRAGYGAYAVSKSGLVTLVLALREELKDTDIAVNAVMPDVIDTWRTRQIPNAQPDNWVKPADIAALLCSLCAGELGGVSGSVFKMFGRL